MPEFRGRFGGGRGGGRGGGGGFGGGFGGGRGGRGGDGSDSDYATDPEGEKFRKLFIGGLSYDTSDKALKEFYEQWGGEVVDVVVMKDPNTKRSRGFGFVTYKLSAQVDEAQANRPHTIDNREVECKRAMPRDGNESQELVNKLFIGGLSNEATEKDLREYFACYGNVQKVNVIFDKETKRNKGFAFIEFDDYDPVDKCVLQKKHHINGKTSDASKALPKDREGGASGGGGRGGRGRGGGGGGYGQQYGGYGGGGGGYGGQSGYGQSSYGGGSDYGGYGGMGQGYGDSYGGGAMRGGGYSQRGQGPYGGGYGSGGGGGGYGGYGQGGGGGW